jgi:SOS regulatory protein LexA
MSTNPLKPPELKGLQFIRNFVLYRGKSPSLRAIAEHMGFKSPRSSSLLIDRLVKKGYLDRSPMGNLRLLKDAGLLVRTEQTVELPLVGTVPCGLPLLAEENTEAWIPVSQRLAKPGAQYFLLRAAGDSMDQRGIHEGDLLLVRQQPVAENGDRVVALLGDEATVKELQRKKDKIILMPRSSNPAHKPIILDRDFMIQGVVVDTLPNPME